MLQSKWSIWYFFPLLPFYLHRSFFFVPLKFNAQVSALNFKREEKKLQPGLQIWFYFPCSSKILSQCLRNMTLLSILLLMDPTIFYYFSFFFFSLFFFGFHRNYQNWAFKFTIDIGFRSSISYALIFVEGALC